MLIAISNYLLICLHMFLSVNLTISTFMSMYHLFICMSICPYLPLVTTFYYSLLILVLHLLTSIYTCIFFFLNALYRHLRFS